MIITDYIDETIELLAGVDHSLHAGNIKRQFPEVSIEAVPQLMELLFHHTNPNVWSAAAALLATIKEETVVDSLIVALDDPDYLVRMIAVILLTLIGDRHAIEPLLELLHDSNTYGVLDLLARFDDKEFVEPIITFLYADTEALAKRNQDNKDFRRSDYFSRIYFRALISFDDPRIIAPLVEAISSRNTEIFGLAFNRLKEIGTDAVEPLMLAYYQETSDQTRIIWLLSEIGDLRAFDLIVNSLKSADIDVQHEAIYAFGELKDPRAISTLLEYLSNLSPDEERLIAATKKVLGELGHIGNEIK